MWVRWGCVAEMGQVMLELRADMYASAQKAAGTAASIAAISEQLLSGINGGYGISLRRIKARLEKEG